MSHPKIYVEPETPTLYVEPVHDDRENIPDISASNIASSELNENESRDSSKIPLEDLKTVMESSEKDSYLHNKFDVSEDELSQITNNSNSVNIHGSNDSLSDSQITQSGEKHTTLPDKKHKKHKKRNRISQMISGVSHKSKSDLFQKLFKDMAGDELLVADYSCALQRDILVHGRLYLSQNWLCFYANIFGWETLVTIQWVDITGITKEKTAKLIPNAIQIFTDTDKYFFSTFVTREHAYTALFRIWQNALLGKPILPKELKMICKKRMTSSRDAMDGFPINDEHDETADEMLEDDDDKSSFVSTSESLTTNDNGKDACKSVNSVAGSSSIATSTPNGDRQRDNVPSVSTFLCSTDNLINVVITGNSSIDNSIEVSTNKERNDIDGLPVVDKKIDSTNPDSKLTNTERERSSSPNSKSNNLSNLNNRKKSKLKHQRSSNFPPFHLNIPGHEGDSTTDDNDSDDDSVLVEPDEDILCPCHELHKGKEYANEEFNFDVDALYEHLFSQESDMMKTVYKQRKFENTKYTPYKREADGSHSQVLSYTIPLNYSIGPKQCNTITKHIMQKENTLGTFYIVKTESTTVGVPYGDSFYVNTQYCITRASGNRSRLRITTEILYTKRVFGLVKNMISRGTDEAVKDYTDFLVNVLKSESDLLSYKEVKPKKKLTKLKPSEAAKSVHHELPRRTPPSSLGHHKIRTTPDAANVKQEVNDKIPVSSLRGFALMFCLLFLMNVYMLSRLRSLEKNIVVSKGEWLPKDLPTTKEGWNNLLEYQRSLHELELHKLKEVIGNTALLLEQVQLSIKGLHGDIEKSIVDGRPQSQSKQLNTKGGKLENNEREKEVKVEVTDGYHNDL